MVTTITMFDTHAAVEALIGKGVQKDQAEVFVRIIQESKDTELARLASKEQVVALKKDVENMMQNAATKADLLASEKRLDEKISSNYNKLDEKIHNVERRLMIMMGGAVVTICGIIIGAMKYLIH